MPFLEELPPHFHGITFYGENIQDEWFIVELIFHLTRKISDLVARVIDSDGEFMMIEAADHLPKWANPDTCTNRVSRLLATRECNLQTKIETDSLGLHP